MVEMFRSSPAAGAADTTLPLAASESSSCFSDVAAGERWARVVCMERTSVYEHADADDDARLFAGKQGAQAARTRVANASGRCIL
eukprot:COSAG01_NODE_3981_length_5461_cov_4.420268_3_plen_85_part_00